MEVISHGLDWPLPHLSLHHHSSPLRFVQVASPGIEPATLPLEEATSVECSTTEPQLLDKKMDICFQKKIEHRPFLRRKPCFSGPIFTLFEKNFVRYLLQNQTA